MINLKILHRAIILSALRSLMAFDYWAQAIGVVVRSAKSAIANPIRLSRDHRNGETRAMITRDLDVSRAYIMLNRFNR